MSLAFTPCFKVQKIWLLQGTSSPSTWILRGHQQTLSTKFLYMHSLQQNKNKMHGILFEWSHLFPLALNVIVNFLFYLGCGDPNLLVRILPFKIQSKISVLFETVKMSVTFCLSPSRIKHFCSKNVMYVHGKIDCLQGPYHLHISSPEWLNAKH